MEFRDIINNLRAQQKSILIGMKMIQESNYPKELLDRLEVIKEDIDNLVETYLHILDKQKLDKKLVSENAQKVLKMSAIQQAALRNKNNDSWDIRVDENKNVIKVAYSQFDKENIVTDVMNYNIRSYVNKMKKDFPELVFESKRYKTTLVSYPTRGNNQYEVEFEIDVKKN